MPDQLTECPDSLAALDRTIGELLQARANLDGADGQFDLVHALDGVLAQDGNYQDASTRAVVAMACRRARLFAVTRACCSAA